MTNGFDQEILQDFLTESGELILQLEGDLVVLEGAPRDPELLNKVFRALHTIKGSASFLALTNLVKVAHASESALNAARNGQVVVDNPMMNLLLEAVDLIKGHLGQIASGTELTAPREALVASLAAIGEGKAAPAASATTAVAEPPAPTAPAQAAARGTHPLVLGPGKLDLLPFLITDLDDTLAKIKTQVDALLTSQSVPDAARAMGEQCEQLARSVEFFECRQMGDLAAELAHAAEKLPSAHQHMAQIVPALRELCGLITHQADGIKAGEVREVPADDTLHHLQDALEGHAHAAPPAQAPAQSAAQSPMQSPAPAAEQPAALAPAPARAQQPAQPAPAAASPAKEDAETAKKPAAGESTIRVEVTRLEALMNLVGELVLQKNRVAGITRRLTSTGQTNPEITEAMTLAAGSLDRVTSDIQLAVMRTRMQPLEKLFGRYPRLIRDLAAKTGKKINLNIEGGETEVDKSVIEELGDPLVHLLRNSCDHGLEGPDERTKSGKGDTGTITLRASHEGSHVRVAIIDDGRGLSRERIGGKAIERGMVTREQLAQLSDREVFKFIFEAGFSTADKVSDLSGRGVGMDVVRTNIAKLKGSVDLSSELGKGTTVSITIPLTVAILQAMMVGVGKEIYAIPLTSILEIVRPTEADLSSIGGHPVLRLRDGILPVISAADVFAQPDSAREECPFAVILQLNDQRLGLMVSRLIGQQEVVIKPLDELRDGPRQAVSGATVRDDGGVSLIVDVAELINLAKTTHASPTLVR